jgi:cation diffusion facilitator family transporter
MSGGHRHGHGHRHVPAPVAATRAGEDEGLRAVARSAAGLGATAAVQFVLVAVSGSVALLADALHNLGDVFTTVTLWVAFVVGRRPGGRRYTFGLARAEDVAGVLVVLAIAVSALVAGWESLSRLVGGVPELRSPGWALAAALVGVVGNEAVAQYKIRVGRRIRSVPLEADGRHSRVDGLASLAAAAGIVGAWAGWPAADPLAGLALTLVICWVLVDATQDVLARLLDRVDEDVLDRIETAASGVAGVSSVHDLRARWVGRALQVLLHADVDGGLPLAQAHTLGERVRHAVFHAVPGIQAVDLHLDPAGADAGHRDTRHHGARGDGREHDHEHAEVDGDGDGQAGDHPDDDHPDDDHHAAHDHERAHGHDHRGRRESGGGGGRA